MVCPCNFYFHEYKRIQKTKKTKKTLSCLSSIYHIMTILYEYAGDDILCINMEVYVHIFYIGDAILYIEVCANVYGPLCTGSHR